MQQSNFTRARVCVCAHLLLHNTAFHHQHRKDAANGAAAVTTPNWRPTECESESEREQKTESEIDYRMPIMLSAPRVCSRLFFVRRRLFVVPLFFFFHFISRSFSCTADAAAHIHVRNSKLNETNYRQFFDDEDIDDGRREKKRQMKWNDLVNRVLSLTMLRNSRYLARAILNRNRWLHVCQNSRCVMQQTERKKIRADVSEREKNRRLTHTHTRTICGDWRKLWSIKYRQFSAHKIQTSDEWTLLLACMPAMRVYVHVCGVIDTRNCERTRACSPSTKRANINIKIIINFIDEKPKQKREKKCENSKAQKRRRWWWRRRRSRKPLDRWPSIYHVQVCDIIVLCQLTTMCICGECVSRNGEHRDTRRTNFSLWYINCWRRVGDEWAAPERQWPQWTAETAANTRATALTAAVELNVADAAALCHQSSSVVVVVAMALFTRVP